MLRFFRQLRQRLLTDNKFSKYLLYAVGEILLVVIGILIALKVNNWNEGQVVKNQLTDALEKVQLDLRKDINILNKIIEDGDKEDSIARLILRSEYDLSAMSEKEKRNLFWTGMSYDPFNYASAGYEKLQSLNAAPPASYKDVIDQVNFHYNSFAPTTMDIYASNIKMVKDRHDYLTLNEAWYKDFIMGKFTKEAEIFFTENPTYQNWTVRFINENAAKKNWVLDALRGSCVTTLLFVNEALGKDTGQQISAFLKKVPEDLHSIEGLYYSKDENTDYQVRIIDGHLIMNEMAFTYLSDLDFVSIGFGQNLKFFQTDEGLYKFSTTDFYNEIEATQQK